MSINWKEAIANPHLKRKRITGLNPCASCRSPRVKYFQDYDSDYNEYSSHLKCQACGRLGPSVTAGYSEHHSDYLQPGFGIADASLLDEALKAAWNYVNPSVEVKCFARIILPEKNKASA